MRKTIAVIAALAAGSLAVAPGAASGASQLGALSAKLNCLVRYPVSQFVDYSWFGQLPAAPPGNAVPDLTPYDPSNPATYPFAPTGVPLNNWGPTTGLDFAFGYPGQSAWLLGVKGTSKCVRKFRMAPAPAARPVALRFHRLAAVR